MLYTLMPFVWVIMVGGWGRVLQGGGELWSVTIVTIQGHRLERLLVEPAAGAGRGRGSCHSRERARIAWSQCTGTCR